MGAFPVITGRLVHARSIFCAIALILCAGTVLAEELTEGSMQIQAQSREPIEPRVGIRFQLANDSELDLRLQTVAIQALRDAGYRVNQPGSVITLRMETQNGTVVSKEDTSIGSLEAGSGVGVDLNVRLWSSTQNSLLKNNSGKNRRIPVFAVTFDAYDDVGGKAAWRGEAVTHSADGINFEAGDAMVRQLISAFGTTLKPKNVPLR